MFTFASNLTRIFILTILLALAISAFAVSPALADGETPPPPDIGTAEVADASTTDVATPTVEATPTVDPTTSGEILSTEEAAPTEIAPTEVPLVTEVAAPTEAAPTEPVSVEEIAQVTVDSAALLSAMPEGTDLVVVDANGETVPLASEEAAEIIIAGDPIWCPNGVAPKPLVGGCSDSYGSIASLVAGYSTGFPGNGTIWVQSGAAAGGTIDGAGAWAARSVYSITIQGGWNGTYGSKGLDPANPTSRFSDAISIINWKGSITIKNISMDVSFNDVDLHYALEVSTQGNITLDHVDVQNSINNGSGTAYAANLDNHNGSGSVKVTNGSFNNNQGGLVINSSNTVTLKNVSAYRNGYEGVLVSAKQVNITNSAFSYNGSSGLSVQSHGAINLNNVSANYNSYGADLRTTAGTPYPISVNGTNSFSGNFQDGLSVLAYGPVKVNNTNANGNGLRGVVIVNAASVNAQPVSITGFLNVMGNGGEGLHIDSKGKVSASNLTASGNGNTGVFNGVFIENGSLGTQPQPVILSGNNVFLGNTNDGLTIVSRGRVSLNNVTASDNDDRGVTIDSSNGTQPVTLSGSNRFIDNNQEGLWIRTGGAVDLSNLTVSGSFSTGARIDNALSPAVQQAVTIRGTNLFAVNSVGLGILSHGTVNLYNLTAIENAEDGVWVRNTGGNTPKPVNIYGANAFNENGTGLFVDSDGAVNVSKVSASHNGGSGLWILNEGPVASGVKITGYGVIQYNGGSGLTISSHGAISLANINASFNGGDGAEISTTLLPGGGPHPVTLTGTNTFNFNGDEADESGLTILADGNITISNLSASFNYDRGALLDNFTTWYTIMGYINYGSVKITGFGQFIHNGNYGLSVKTHGMVSLNRVLADANGVHGVDISADGSVALICSRVTGNFFGITVDGAMNPSAGPITLKGVVMYYNTSYNESLDAASVVRSSCP